MDVLAELEIRHLKINVQEYVNTDNHLSQLMGRPHNKINPTGVLLVTLNTDEVVTYKQYIAHGNLQKAVSSASSEEIII